jgi:hypothetical protein
MTKRFIRNRQLACQFLFILHNKERIKVPDHKKRDLFLVFYAQFKVINNSIVNIFLIKTPIN